MKKIAKVFTTMALLLGLTLTGCGNSDDSASTSTNNQGSNTPTTSGETLELKLGHNLAEDHAVHIALTEFAKDVEENTDGSLKIKIFPNGTLGSETDMITQISNGALDMAKVSAATLGNFSENYNLFSIPYVFTDKDHYYKAMDSDVVKNIFESTKDKGFVGLTWLDSGARSFYTVDKPIKKPTDLKGLKIRTMDSQMAIDMMKNLGGSSTVMGYSDIYTSLQSGVIDGAENNITALRDHGEVAKYYSEDEHTRIPDIVVISSSVMDKLSDDQKSAIKEAAENMKEKYKDSWQEFENEVKKDVTEKYNVNFVEDVDKEAFKKAVQPIYDNLKKDKPEIYKSVEEIQNIK